MKFRGILYMHKRTEPLQQKMQLRSSGQNKEQAGTRSSRRPSSFQISPAVLRHYYTSWICY